MEGSWLGVAWWLPRLDQSHLQRGALGSHALLLALRRPHRVAPRRRWRVASPAKPTQTARLTSAARGRGPGWARQGRGSVRGGAWGERRAAGRLLQLPLQLLPSPLRPRRLLQPSRLIQRRGSIGARRCSSRSLPSDQCLRVGAALCELHHAIR